MQFVGEARHWPWNLNGKSGVLGHTLTYLNVILYTPWHMVLLATIVFLLLGLGMAFLIDPNKFSLHAVYRDRLIRAYLGASNPHRKPNPFTGFDEEDNVRMRVLWDETKFQKRLLPVINIALNLVGGAKLAWQDRKAESFTISPLALRIERGRLSQNGCAGECALWRRKRHLVRRRGRNFGRGGEPEHGLSLVAACHLYYDAVERAAGRMAGKSRAQPATKHFTSVTPRSALRRFCLKHLA